MLSTLGGIAAFATTTVPLLLLPRARDARARRAAAALGVAAALGLAAVAVVAIAPATLVDAVFGERYAAVAPIAVPYVVAMALLGVARVLIAHLRAGAVARGSRSRCRRRAAICRPASCSRSATTPRASRSRR